MSMNENEIDKKLKKSSSFGFIMTRHVNNPRSNLYWQECYRCIRQCYPDVMVMIIDDNSNYDNIHIIPTTPPLLNCIIIKSEFPGRGNYWRIIIS